MSAATVSAVDDHRGEISPSHCTISSGMTETWTRFLQHEFTLVFAIAQWALATLLLQCNAFSMCWLTSFSRSKSPPSTSAASQPVKPNIAESLARPMANRYRLR